MNKKDINAEVFYSHNDNSCNTDLLIEDCGLSEILTKEELKALLLLCKSKRFEQTSFGSEELGWTVVNNNWDE